MTSNIFRLITRSDFDGLVCAALLKDMNMIDDIKFVHPKDMQDGKIAVTKQDVLTNLPYVAGCHLCFDHHYSEVLRNDGHDNHIIDPGSPSASRVVFKHFGGAKKFPNISAELMDAVDKSDSANFKQQEILNPQGWDLISFLMDARTGLGRFHEFTISNYGLMMNLIDCCLDLSVEEIIQLPDVQERIKIYHEHSRLAVEQIQRCAKVKDNLVVLDLTREKSIYAVNRFMIYALFPQCNISLHKMWGLQKQNIVFAIGKSILNKGARSNIGQMCLHYNGGGHKNAGTCQIDIDEASRVLQQLITKINQDG
ncbi:MAG: nanoRNase/pAp phosphatase (c-di-AMP/oligoRNAs hydrolase) [Paraglaciecola sp.]|jgi:nanoRNase/pAp phosphatase (c-di-AMP/oligoRNAs hydrolase)